MPTLTIAGANMIQLKQVLRYALALTVAPLMASLVAIPFAIAVDMFCGKSVTGGAWPLTFPNIVVTVFMGVITGWLAGWIARRRGTLVGAAANFSFLILLSIASLVTNRNFTASSHFAVQPGVWALIGLLPAMIGGHFAVQLKELKPSEFFEIAAMFLMTISGIGWTAFHFFTIYVGFKIGGIIPAIATLALPVISEGYWLGKSWTSSQHFLNSYG